MVLSASAVSSPTPQDGSSYGVFFRQRVLRCSGSSLFWIGLRVPPAAAAGGEPVAARGLAWCCWSSCSCRASAPRSTARAAGSRRGALDAAVGAREDRARALGRARARRAAAPHPTAWRAALLAAACPSRCWSLAARARPARPRHDDLARDHRASPCCGSRARRCGLMAFIVSSGVVASVVLGVVATYRQSRITAFLNPDTADPLGPAYQARQALYSLADGGLFGAGLGQGRGEVELPAQRRTTTSSSRSSARSWGSSGRSRCSPCSPRSPTSGCGSPRAASTRGSASSPRRSPSGWSAQACINIGYVVGLLPVTGLQLPLISSGGTSLAITLFCSAACSPTSRGTSPRRSPPCAPHGQGRLARALRLPEPSLPRAAATDRPARRGRTPAEGGR